MKDRIRGRRESKREEQRGAERERGEPFYVAEEKGETEKEKKGFVRGKNKMKNKTKKNKVESRKPLFLSLL